MPLDVHTINYKSYGETSDVPLICVHGLQSSLETFITVAEKLSTDIQVITYDQRGHGNTPKLGEDYTVDTMAQDLKKLMDHLKIKKAHLLGHSMGGRAVMRFAGLYAEMTASLIIEDMGIQKRVVRTQTKDQDKLMKARTLSKYSRDYETKEEIREILQPLFSYADDLMRSKVIETPYGFHLKFWPDVAILYGYQGNYTDLTKDVKKYPGRKMVMVADFEVGSAMTKDCVEHIKKHVPDMEIVYFPGAWHSIHKSDLTTFLEKVRGHLG